jgi:uncharacterized protein (DUF305 family)
MRSTRTTSTAARLAALAAGTALAAALAGCGASGSGGDAAPPAASAPAAAAPSGVSAEHNDADLRFAQMMIPHHEQALEMAQLAAGRASAQPVEDLAERIRAAQGPEIATLNGLLQAWGAPATGGTAGMDHGGTDYGGTDHGGTDHGGASPMSGMMTAEQMDQLEAASGAEFDRMFLEMMIAHHEGAVADARTALAEGTNPQAEELARRIVDGQTAEITQMRQMQGA